MASGSAKALRDFHNRASAFVQSQETAQSLRRTVLGRLLPERVVARGVQDPVVLPVLLGVGGQLSAVAIFAICGLERANNLRNSRVEGLG